VHQEIESKPAPKKEKKQKEHHHANHVPTASKAEEKKAEPAQTPVPTPV